MYPTIEVRWFGAGVPASAMAWWLTREADDLEEEPPRVDAYLSAVGDSLGIKLRQGRVEIKQRQAVYGAVQLGEDVRGIAEKWHKWSFAIARPDRRLADLDFSWMRVKKQRWMRRYGIDGSRAFLLAPVLDSDVRTCEVELTRVEFAGGKWWSFCLEALGRDEGDIRDVLVPVAEHVFEPGHNPPELFEKDSCGYARWLEMRSGDMWGCPRAKETLRGTIHHN